MVAMAVLATAANVVNYASSLVFSRVLEPVGFGELTSLLALAMVLAVPLGAAQTVVAERIAMASAAGDVQRLRYLIRLALGHVAALGLVAGIAYMAAVPLVMEVLSIREPGPALALGPFLVLSFMSPVVLGVLQGMERFAAFGLVILAIAVSRIAFGVPWALQGGGAGGAIAGQALGLLVVTVGVAWRYRSWLLRRGTGAATRGLTRKLDVTSLSASGAFIAFALLSNLDLLLARVYLDGNDAGIYAALATVAKVVIFLPSAVAVILVPRAVRDQAETGSGARALRLSAALVTAAALACLAVALVAPGLVVEVMFGPGYEAAEGGVLPAVLAGSGLAMLNLLCVYSVAIRDRRWMLVLIGGLAVQLVAIALLHDSPVEVAWAQALVGLVVLVVNELAFHPLVRRSTLPR
jgi:O-antigen/teichoic acid export membrane protein